MNAQTANSSDAAASVAKNSGSAHRRLRVAMVVYSFYLTDSRVRQYATALADRGDHVDILALSSSPTQPAIESYGGVTVYNIQQRKKDERGLFDYAQRLGRFFLKASWTLTRMQRKQKYDIVHVHNIPDFLVFSALWPKLTGTPVILDIHDILPEFYASKFNSPENSLLSRVIHLAERISVRFANHVIVANDIWRDRVANRCRAEEKCTTVRNYPDPRVFHAPEGRSKDYKFVIVYPGSLNHHQGLDIAIRAFARVADKMPNAEFKIYGGGPDKPKLIQMVRDLRLDNRISFRDYLPVAEIVKVMSNADLAVVPKRATNKFGNEAASTKILEFMTLGVPVVVTRTRIDSLYFDDKLVRFFESDNDAQLADEIFFLYSNPRVCAELAANSLDHAQRNSWPTRQHDYLTLVDSLIKCTPVMAGR
jgi:glycosyltransferase involved in cell wall biosynthesis